MGDQEDKQWLFENGHLPITGGKVSLMRARESYLAWAISKIDLTKMAENLDARPQHKLTSIACVTN